MENILIQSILKKITFSFSILLFFFGIHLGYFKSARRQSTSPMVRVAVKTKVPLTQTVMDQLATYGHMNRRLMKLDLVDLQVPTKNLSSLVADPLVQSVEQDQETHTLGLPPLTESDFSSAVSSWNDDIINVTDSVLNPDPFWQTPTVPTRVVDYDGDGVYVAILDTGLVNHWREIFPEARVAQDLATTFTGRQPGFEETDHTITVRTDRLWENDTDGHGTSVTSI